MSLFLESDRPIALVHRGGNERFPENTLAAFQHAYDLGYRYFETDVHFTAGQELVAFHDDNLLRTTGYHGRITDMTKRERAATLVEGEHPIPLLSELLEVFPDVRFNIDAKHPAAVQPLVDTVQKYSAEDRVCLASFSPKSMLAIRRKLPHVCTVTTRNEVLKLAFGRSIAKQTNGVYCVEIPKFIKAGGKKIHVATERFIDRAHKQDLKVLVWTIDEPDEIRKLLDMGVDGIFTDKPTALKEVFEERGIWQQIK